MGLPVSPSLASQVPGPRPGQSLVFSNTLPPRQRIITQWEGVAVSTETEHHSALSRAASAQWALRGSHCHHPSVFLEVCSPLAFQPSCPPTGSPCTFGSSCCDHTPFDVHILGMCVLGPQSMPCSLGGSPLSWVQPLPIAVSCESLSLLLGPPCPWTVQSTSHRTASDLAHLSTALTHLSCSLSQRVVLVSGRSRLVVGPTLLTSHTSSIPAP